MFHALKPSEQIATNLGKNWVANHLGKNISLLIAPYSPISYTKDTQRRLSKAYEHQLSRHLSNRGHPLEELEPFLDISGPDGQHFRMGLTKDRITIGRLKVFNDVALEPDPQHLITRKVHCSLERDADGWWVIDNGSLNRTFRRRGSEIEMVQGRARLEDGDSVLILGNLTETGNPSYWELTFRDPMGTRPSVHLHLVVSAYLEYDWIQAKLFRVSGSVRQEIQDLRPQEHKLIRYMDQRNRANGNVAVMCTSEELLAAIWGEEALHTETDLAHLVWELRQKLEPNPKEPRFLETVRGLGYRLVPRLSRK